LPRGKLQNVVDRFFNVAGKQIVENFKDFQRLRDVRIIELANLGIYNTSEQQSELDAFKLSEG
jgi:hypothetical protein